MTREEYEKIKGTLDIGKAKDLLKKFIVELDSQIKKSYLDTWEYDKKNKVKKMNRYAVLIYKMLLEEEEFNTTATKKGYDMICMFYDRNEKDIDIFSNILDESKLEIFRSFNIYFNMYMLQQLEKKEV